MIRVEPRTPSRALAAAVPVLSAAAALALAAIPLALAGADLAEAYALMAKGVFGSRFALSETLTRATPLILTGLAAALAFRARLWNIGGEGQLYLGALAAAAVGSGAVSGPSWLLIPLVLAAGAAAGAAGMAGPAWLKIRFGADEVVTTLLMNFVVILFVQMMLEGPMQDPMGMGWPQSAPVLDEATLPRLAERTRLHAGLPIALALVVAAHVALSRTVWGLKIRAVGENAAAARHAGIPVGRTLMSAALVSGALAGLAGAGEVAGLKGYLTADLSPGYGYAGIVAAMLAGLSPLGVAASAAYIAAVFVGADSMSRALGVSNYLADLVVALSLLSVLVGGFFARNRLVAVRAGKAGEGA
ncbi:simple sugar transport system permease protein [Oceanicella actignis]|nr:ABC transporter permease [Oceanicella actignis]TYO90678.1 simple sugar transport system permease protein [Oceanicella actignis]